MNTQNSLFAHCPDCATSMHKKHDRTYANHTAQCSYLCGPRVENLAPVGGSAGNSGHGVCTSQRYMVAHHIHGFPNVLTVKAKSPSLARSAARRRLARINPSYAAVAVFLSVELESVLLDHYMSKFA